MKILLLFLALILTTCTSQKDLLTFGKNQMIQTDYYKAIETFSKVIKKNPKSVQAYKMRSSCYHRIDSITREIRDYDTLLSWETTQEERANYYYLKGNAYYAILNDKAACFWWKEARDQNYLKAWDKIRLYCK